MTVIAPGRIYVSAPDRHMLLEDDRVRIVRGPKENRHRPAIDPLFRSAAWAYGPRVVGVVLTGSGDDGAAGQWAIRSCGGTTVVQDPATAAHSEMPESALLHNEIDHVLPLKEIAPLLARLAHEPIDGHDYPRRQSLKTEVEFDTMSRDITDMGSLGKLSPFTCPSCRGALWELQDGDILRYRCHTGHAFSEKSLQAEQSSATEEGLYSALRAVEEKAALLRRLSKGWRERHPHLVTDYQTRAGELDQSAELLRKLITRGNL
jgi:two-component system chemotaxis response regulator CheB